MYLLIFNIYIYILKHCVLQDEQIGRKKSVLYKKKITLQPHQPNLQTQLSLNKSCTMAKARLPVVVITTAITGSTTGKHQAKEQTFGRNGFILSFHHVQVLKVQHVNLCHLVATLKIAALIHSASLLQASQWTPVVFMHLTEDAVDDTHWRVLHLMMRFHLFEPPVDIIYTLHLWVTLASVDGLVGWSWWWCADFALQWFEGLLTAWTEWSVTASAVCGFVALIGNPVSKSSSLRETPEPFDKVGACY